jgi:hypothetical protein
MDRNCSCYRGFWCLHAVALGLATSCESSVTTYYYLTLELAGGQRREFMVGIGDYSLLAERDSISCELQGAAVRKIQRLR